MPQDSTWSIANLTSIFLQNTKNTALWSDSEDSEEDDDLRMSDIHFESGTMEYSTTEEAISAQALLTLLERENASLELDPKTILADNGKIKLNKSTLKTLTKEEEERIADFWSSFLQDPIQQMSKFPHLILSKIKTSAIPNELRGKVWILLSGAKVDRMKTLFSSLLAEDSKFNGMIQKDVPRTFPNTALFKDPEGEGQMKLFKVLKAYSVYDQDIGYCQGLCFCIGPLIMQGLSEEEAFAILVRLMEDDDSDSNTLGALNYGMRSLFNTGLVGLHVAIFQHGALLQKHLPDLHGHFQEHNLSPSMYCAQWFLTLFTYSFPIDLVFRIFDIMLAENIMITLHRFALALIRRNQSVLLQQTSFEAILEKTKGQRLLDAFEDLDEIVKEAISLTKEVTPECLAEMKQQYFKEQTKFGNEKQKNEILALRHELIKYKTEAEKSREKIQSLLQENEKLKESNEQMKRDLIESDTSRIQLLKDCHVLQARIDALENSK